MKKNKLILLVLGILCTLSGYAQEEFLGDNTGLSVSGSTDFSTDNSNLSTYKAGQLSLHLKNGLIFSGSVLVPNNNSNSAIIPTIGYLLDINKKNKINKFNLLFSISYLKIVSPTIGIIYTSFKDDNFPTSLGLSGYLADPTVSFYFAQSFFAKNPVYPVVGLTYSLYLEHFYSSGIPPFNFHVGINVNLSALNTKK